MRRINISEFWVGRRRQEMLLLSILRGQSHLKGMGKKPSSITPKVFSSGPPSTVDFHFPALHCAFVDEARQNTHTHTDNDYPCYTGCA